MACPAHPAPRPRPALEVADIVRACGGAYRATHRLSVQQERVLQAIAQCRVGGGNSSSSSGEVVARVFDRAICR